MVAIRPATAADLPQCHGVWLSTERYDGPVTDAVLPLHEHELRHGRLVVADAGAAGVVGFGGTLVRSGVAYLCDLFVAPAWQGRGVGRQLLDVLLGGHQGPSFTMASSSPAARALYARHGMAPAWELSYVVARAGELALGALDPAGVRADAAAIADVLRLDRAVTGRDREPELHHETERLGGRLLALRRGRRVVGHAVVISPTWWVPWRPQGTQVAPVVVGDPADAAAAVSAAVLHAVSNGARAITTSVPVPHPAHATLLAAGFRRTDTDLHMTSDPALVDPTRYLPSINTV